MSVYANSLEHLLAEIERVDLLIQAQVDHASRLQATDERFSGLYISKEELDQLLAKPNGVPRWVQGVNEERDQQIRARLAMLEAELHNRALESQQQGISLRLLQLAEKFKLDEFDVNALLICLAPELDLRYQRVYAYLQDDITKKQPSVELLLNLLAPSLREKLSYFPRFSSDAPLLRYRLLEFVNDPPQLVGQWLSKALKIDERIKDYLFGSDALSINIRPYARTIVPDTERVVLPPASEVHQKLESLLGMSSDSPYILYLHGPYGAGQQVVAEAVCRQRNLVLLVVDFPHLLHTEEGNLNRAVHLLHREALLQGGFLFFDSVDILLESGREHARKVFVRSLDEIDALVFLSGELSWGQEAVESEHFLRIEIPRASASEREAIWSVALNGQLQTSSDLSVQDLAGKFRFTSGQIQDAIGTASQLSSLRDAGPDRVTMQDVLEACRMQSNQQLTRLARKIRPKYRWEDIVLPADRLDQLRELCNQVKYRQIVHERWGFDRKLSQGKGLAVLFAGPSGTGKTMAAEVIATELGLDLYKIDLSTVVNKYIGETEKNLSRIFTEAETSNAILFFDEADTLFGKRSDVKDAHDRYANIEVGYLLQRMEEYSGVAILATNFRKNMDEAFVRRLQFAVDFPFPDEANRRRIWDAVWPEQTPLAPDLDLNLMAQRFEITGGNIRNVAVASAFLAADNGNEVAMTHLLRATRREYQKMGKIAAEEDFEQMARRL